MPRCLVSSESPHPIVYGSDRARSSASSAPGWFLTREPRIGGAWKWRRYSRGLMPTSPRKRSRNVVIDEKPTSAAICSTD